ncbi:glycosyltransferase family 2 protein [Patescibacteria group bacterium]|nr:MAG: glycosyltransferase family 2 protein [Patescibacteria group bacterium]
MKNVGCRIFFILHPTVYILHPTAMTPRVHLTIVAWNSLRYLPELLASVEAQTFRDFQAFIIDNGSVDGSEAYVRAHHPRVAYLRNARNLGFAAAHNQGIRYALSHWPSDDLARRYALVVNPDVILAPDFLEKIVAAADAHPEAGSLGGKLLRASRERLEDEDLRETVKSDVIDSTGLRGTRARTVADRGAGELDRGQYDALTDVFGISGALALYRASALEDVKVDEEYFDADFFAYKEDVDLAWRLRLAGFSALFVPEARAHHHRAMGGSESAGAFKRLRERFGRSQARSGYSARNHWNMLMKDELFVNGLLASPWILCREALQLAYVAVFETRNLGAFVQALARLPRMLRKRREIMRSRKASAKEMRKWFV